MEQTKVHNVGFTISEEEANKFNLCIQGGCIMKMYKYDFLPNDIKTVIIDGNTVIVNLRDGRKGVSKCSCNDEFDTYTGFTIAYYKAKNNKSFKLKQVLDNCLQSANEKGYAKAILKNY